MWIINKKDKKKENTRCRDRAEGRESKVAESTTQKHFLPPMSKKLFNFTEPLLVYIKKKSL